MALSDHVIHLENGQLAAENPRSTIDAMATKAVEKGSIVIHFHGGLVSRASGMQIAERLLPRYEQGGAWPVFFVWESGLLETLQNNLGEILRESFFQRALERVLEFVKRKFAQGSADRAAGSLPAVDRSAIDDAVRAAAAAGDPAALAGLDTSPAAPVTELTLGEQLQIENELLLDTNLAEAIEHVSNGLLPPDEFVRRPVDRSATLRGSTTTLMDPSAIDRLVDRPDATSRGLLSTAKMVKALVQVIVSVLSRYAKGRDHGLHATVVEELLREFYVANVGEWVWARMKGDTVDACDEDGQRAGGTAFLEALAAAMDPAHPPRITLVGHSTGAVFISHFLKRAAEILPDVKFGVVFLAPASTFELTAKTLEEQGTSIDGFRMFAMRDDLEQKDRLVPVLYPHSLLYFVSGVVEPDADTPIVGMQRFYDADRFPSGTFPHVDKVRAFVEGQDDRAVWSVVAGPRGRASTSESHPDFDNDEATVASLEHILQDRF